MQLTGCSIDIDGAKDPGNTFYDVEIEQLTFNIKNLVSKLLLP